ncbi:MAG: RagB/SusD family nutrient uptake outer membrane protein [Dysgonomonas sp.]|nr:RagB/SusD family nutrient uptake outer membrane protein [Dysgonomonas sp.]
MKNIRIYLLSFLLLGFTLSGCSDFLDEEPDNIFTDDQIFGDVSMMKSALANFYGRVDWGPSLNDFDAHAYLDEAAFSTGGPRTDRGFGDDWWRLYRRKNDDDKKNDAYVLIRELNIFLHGLQSDAAKNNADLSEQDIKEYEGQIRFLRAYSYFTMCKGIGGVPIVGDEVFDYDPSKPDVGSLRVARAKEHEVYDYVINECTEVADNLLANAEFNDYNKNKHAAYANKWAALALKARAALYAGSLAKYNNIITPDIVLSGGEVGIPADKADYYYNIAYTTATKFIAESPYSLYENNPDKGRNFYDALITKQSNPEVIWALDYIYPGKTNEFTKLNIVTSMSTDVEANRITPILNVVEDFEYINDRDGKLKLTDASGEYVYYDNMEDIFKGKDSRLEGTIIYPGSSFRGTRITYQAGQKYLENGKWANRTGDPGVTDPTYGIITDQNGPVVNNLEHMNKTGFNIRKFVDEKPDAATRGRGSEVWFVRFRYAEILLIAAESSLELNKSQSEVSGYINQIRERAGIQPLSTVTFDDIIQENRVEFVYENHRWWDLKRWRLAHTIWNGQSTNEKAVHYSLFPYQIYQPGHAQHGKWVFDKVKTYTTEYPRNFERRNYYNFFDQDWINKNPLLVKNPGQ